VNDMIARLQELELLSKDIRLHQISVEKNFITGMVRRNNAVVVHHRIAAEWRNAVETSAMMQSRIYRVLQ